MKRKGISEGISVPGVVAAGLTAGAVMAGWATTTPRKSRNMAMSSCQVFMKSRGCRSLCTGMVEAKKTYTSRMTTQLTTARLRACTGSATQCCQTGVSPRGRYAPATTVMYNRTTATSDHNRSFLPRLICQPSHTAMGICIHTGKTAAGYISNNRATIMAKMEITTHSRNCMMNWKA